MPEAWTVWEAAAGTFRQELYYRLSVIPMSIPALRERPEDIPLLAYRFALRTAEETGKRLDGIARVALECLGKSDALYHNVEHTFLVTLVGRDILRGRMLTERLELWQPGKDDLAAMYAIVCDTETGRYLGGASGMPDHFQRFARNAGSWWLYGYGPFIVRRRGSATATRS